MTSPRTLDELSDSQLTTRLIATYASERQAVSEVVVLLMEVERRELHLAEGFASLFEYCQDKLSMSEDVAGTRIGLMRVVKQYPLVLSMLASARLHASGVRLLRPHLTTANHRELLEAAAGRSKRDIDKLLAERFPKPDVKSSVRKLPERKQAPAPGEIFDKPESSPPGGPGEMGRSESPSPQSPRHAVDDNKPRRKIKPLSARRFGVSFTATAELVGKLERAQALLSHTLPNGDIATVIERALTLLIEDTEKRRFGGSARRARRPVGANKRAREQDNEAAEEPLVSEPAGEGVTESAASSCSAKDDARTCGGAKANDSMASRSRYVPAAVRREVYECAGGRCTYVAPDGRRCTQTRWLQLDHVQPWASGGQSTAANLRLLCKAHNLHAARASFGRDYVASRIEQSRQRRPPQRATRHDEGRSS